MATASRSKSQRAKRQVRSEASRRTLGSRMQAHEDIKAASSFSKDEVVALGGLGKARAERACTLRRLRGGREPEADR